MTKRWNENEWTYLRGIVWFVGYSLGLVSVSLCFGYQLGRFYGG